MDFFLTLLIPSIVGLILTFAVTGLKSIATWVDALNPWIQRVIVGLLGYGAIWLTSHLGVPVPEDVLHMDGQTVSAVLTALFAFLYHKIRKDA